MHPLRLTELRDVPHVNLLLLTDGAKRHYVLIKSLSRLIAPRSAHRSQCCPCIYCLHVFYRADLLADHVPHCKPHGAQRIKMPSGDDTSIFFKHEDHQLRAPFIIYADFECYTKPIDTSESAANNQRYQEHEPSSFCCYVVSDHPDYKSTPTVYCGPDVVDRFLQALLNEQLHINATIDCPVPMTMASTDTDSVQVRHRVPHLRV